MDTVKDLLSKYAPQEPPEVKLVKQYIQEQFAAPAQVRLQGDTAIIITVHSAALAGSLRMHLPALQKAAQTAKRLVLRIA